MSCNLCNETKKIKVSAGQVCPHCEGRGEYFIESGGGREEVVPCSSCNGQGKFETAQTVSCWWCVPGY